MSVPMQEETRSDFKARFGSMKVEELMNRFPASKSVLYNHFGASCFECPAASEEIVAFAIRVHDSQEEQFYTDLAETLQIGLDEVLNP